MVSVWLSNLYLEVISALKKNNEMIYTPFIKQNVLQISCNFTINICSINGLNSNLLLG